MRVAVCGLGRMGGAFADALVAEGHGVTVWNRTPGRGVAGTAVAESPAAAAGTAEVVVVMVLDGPAAREVLFGPDGVARGAAVADASGGGTVVVNASTVGPDESRALAAEAAGAGLRYVEAPVLGSVPAVRAATLTVLVGGEDSDVAAALPVLRAWSHAGQVRHTGEVGTASALKLVANLGLGVVAAGLRDAVALGRELGLAREAVLDVLADGHFGRLVAAKRERLDTGDYGGADFTLGALAKDLGLMLAAGGSLPLPVVEAAAGVVRAGVERGGGDSDIAVLGA
ncbi:NAD(P)-dependent oxidoreductase [Kitasatospora sp. NPDC051914]|uniref:NAD(P)-dependent oxidoreductase n=1 Tax=Kitasatospora sp. NPDC051914 TaxID=3154945 RepID=UPI0034196669